MCNECALHVCTFMYAYAVAGWSHATISHVDTFCASCLWVVQFSLIQSFRKKKKKIWNRMTASVLKQDPNTKRFKQTLIYFNMDMVCKFSGKSPLSSHKTTLKQQINGQKQWGKNHLSCFGLVFTVCSVLKDSSKQDKSFSFIFHCFWPFICCFVAW